MARDNATAPRGLVWDWSAAAVGAAYALPAAAVAISEPKRGVALAIGVLPAAIVGLAPARRRRLVLIAVGFLCGIPMFLGGLLAGAPVLAVLTIAALGAGAGFLATRSPLGVIAMVLCLPLLGIGLSFDDLDTASGLAGLMVAGSVYACLVSMLWPERLRSIGRVLAVVAGSLAAITLVRLELADAWYGIAVVAAVAGAAGTRRGSWYVTPAFTTFLVFLLLLYSAPGDAGARFAERLGETALGVAIAYGFGLALPALMARRRER